MTLQLEALSPPEGIGIVRIGQQLRLLRPPYQRVDSPILPDGALRDAISRYGFSAVAHSFADWQSTIAFLNEQVIESRRALGEELPQDLAATEVIEVAPPEVLDSFLDRVERHLIPSRAFDQVEAFLVALINPQVLVSHPDLVTRAADLLRQNREARRHAETAFVELAERDLRFPALERHNGLQAARLQSEQIRQRGCIFT